MKWLFPLCIILCLSATAHAAPKTILKAETAKFASTAGGAEISGYYYRPAGDGPFPVIVGCMVAADFSRAIARPSSTPGSIGPSGSSRRAIC